MLGILQGSLHFVFHTVLPKPRVPRVIVTIWQMKKLILREVKYLPQGCSVAKWRAGAQPWACLDV